MIEDRGFWINYGRGKSCMAQKHLYLTSALSGIRQVSAKRVTKRMDILLEINMPVKDGISTLKELKREGP